MPPCRRHYLSLAATVVTAGLAGCAGTSDTPATSPTSSGTDDTTPPPATASTIDATTTGAPPTTEEPAIARAGIDDAVEGEQVRLVVEGVERGVDLDASHQPAANAEFVVVSLAVENTSPGDAVSTPLRAILLRDEDYVVYERLDDGLAEAAFTDGTIAPGAIERGPIAFEVRTAASGLELLCDVAAASFGGTAMIVFDLASTAANSHGRS
jgi:hypothetical protein